VGRCESCAVFPGGAHVISIAVGTYVFALILTELGTNPWYSLVYGLFGSQFLALLTSSAEPMAFLFVVVAIYCWLCHRLWLAVTAFAVAGLTKETALLFVHAFIG
jgi:uncharacterized membrane protein YczE